MPKAWIDPLSGLTDAFSSKLKTTIIGHLVNVYLSGSKEVMEWGRTKFTDNPIYFEGPPIKAAYEYARKHAGELIKSMDEETQSRLANVISRGIEEKRGIDGLARDIRAEFEDMMKFRSEMIARTETADALEQGFIDRSKDLGVTGKEWVVTDPCPICEENGNVGAIPIDDEFPSGHLRPPAHPNCRCALAPVMLKTHESEIVIEISCPNCNGDSFNIVEDEYECCSCKKLFHMVYESDKKVLIEGGPGSGNFGHAGIPGQVGGSQGKGGGVTTEHRDRASRLHSSAVKNEPKITPRVNEVAIITGGTMAGSEFAVKSEESTARKIRDYQREEGMSLEQAENSVVDSVRYTITYPEEGFGGKVLEAQGRLQAKGYHIMDNKQSVYFGSKGPYQGYNTGMVDDAGNKFELQFHTPESYRIKNDIHKDYEKYRLAKNPDTKAFLGQRMATAWEGFRMPEGVEMLRGVRK